MASFKKAPKEVVEMVNSILCEFETHKPILDAHVKIEILMAYADRDDNGEIKGQALTLHGVRALGICKIMAAEHRAAGSADARILVDGDWWESVDEPEQRALIDHECHHVALKTKKIGGPAEFDDQGRPKLRIRPHDQQIGWFKLIAARHGAASQEQIQARAMMQDGGQYFWPDLFPGNAVTPAAKIGHKALGARAAAP